CMPLPGGAGEPRARLHEVAFDAKAELVGKADLILGFGFTGFGPALQLRQIGNRLRRFGEGRGEAVGRRRPELVDTYAADQPGAEQPSAEQTGTPHSGNAPRPVFGISNRARPSRVSLQITQSGLIGLSNQGSAQPALMQEVMV